MSSGGPVWLVAGSGPSARVGIRAAYAHRHVQVSITCNGGAELFNGKNAPVHPTFYYLNDEVACRRYGETANLLQVRYGTLILAIKRRPTVQKRLKLDFVDQLIEQNRGNPIGEHTPGSCSVVHLSGLAIADIALKRGAKTIMLVGFDGYNSDPSQSSYFDGRCGGANGLTRNAYQRRYFETAIEREPDVKFIWFGRPSWSLPEARNVEVLTADGVAKERACEAAKSYR